jgi:large repetitive protein
MPKFNWREWLKSFFAAARKPVQRNPRKRRHRLDIEQLENRLSPATAIWTGASPAGTFLWSDPANFNRVGGGAIQAGDDLVFDNTGASHLNSFDDEPAGFVVNSITISDTNGGYNLAPKGTAAANSIVLGSATTTGNLIVNTSGANTISLNIGFGGTSGNELFNTTLASSVLTLSGQLSGPSGDTLNKAGVGQVNLTNANSGFGSTNISAGVLDISNATALATSAVTVQANARLELNTAAATTFANALTLNGPGAANVGALYDLAGNNTWAGNITLGTDSTIGVNPPGNSSVGINTLTITGVIGDASSQSLTKEGAGTLFLNPLNTLAGNTYHGNTFVNGGQLQIGHPFALGAGGARTTVNASILESGSLSLNYANNPAVLIDPKYLNFANVQTITLTNATTATAFSVTTGNATTAPIPFTGTAADATNLQTALNALSTIGGIGGIATVNQVSAGVFTVLYSGNLSGLGLPLLTGSVTSGPGTLAVTSSVNSTPVGFQVPNEQLTLNGFGVAGVFVTPRNVGTRTTGPAPAAEVIGALNNQAGNNSWQSPVTFFTSASNVFNNSGYYEPAVTVGAVVGTSLTINGVIGDNGVGLSKAYSFSKVGNGRLILTTANTFTADFDILQGTLNVRDSNALGLTAGIGKEAWWGTSLELQADGTPDSVPLASKLPGQSAFDLLFPATNTIQLDGPGFDGEGALRNISGVNHIEGFVNLLTGSAGGFSGTTAIGVTFDPDPFNQQGNTYNDLSQLTIDGVIKDPLIAQFPVTQISAHGETTLTKVGLGELVLTNANTYLGPNFGEGTAQTYINQGWVTIDNNQALGGTFTNPSETLSPTVQPGVSVADGASLVLKRDVNHNNLNLAYNMQLAGTGITHYSSSLNHNGSLLNLQGDNLLLGDEILNGVITVAFQKALGNQPVLDMTAGIGKLTGAAPNINGSPSVGIRTLTPGGASQNAVQTLTFEGNIVGGTFTLTVNGATTGPIAWSASAASLSVNIQVALNTLLGAGNSLVSSANQVGIGAELDGSVAPLPFSQLTMRGQISEAYTSGQIIKLGSQRVILQGDGIYTGGIDDRQGVLRIQNDTAIGLPLAAGANTTLTVENGAALEVAPTLPLQTGSIERGLQVFGTHLILNGTGNSTFNDAALTILSNDNAWRGPITLNSDISVTFRGPAGFRAVPTMTAATLTGTGVVSAASTTVGSIGTPGVNAAQTLSFSPAFKAGDTFTLTVSNGTQTATTAAIVYSTNAATLIANIQAALNGMALEALFSAEPAPSFALVALLSPVIDIAPNSRLNVLGAIDDGAATSAAPDLFVAGGGELLLGGNNTFRGTAFVNQGILTLANAAALGGTGIAGSQELALVNPVAGATQFTLTFNGATSAPLTFTGTDADATSIQTALAALAAPGSVTVTQSNPGVFLATFGGSLAGTLLPLTAVVTAGSGTALVVTDGATVVAPAAQLQLEGNITIAGEPLAMQGTGTGLESTQQNVVIGGTLDGVTGAQQLSLPNAQAGTTTFQLTFNGGTTAVLNYTGTDTDATTIQTALTPLLPAGGTVLVTPSSPGIFLVMFGGSLSGSVQPLLTGTVIAGPGFVLAGRTGTFTLGFTNPITSATSTTGALRVGATAAEVQQALNSLAAIAQGGTTGTGGGSVTVEQTGVNLYNVIFGGTFAGLPEPLLVATPAGGATAIVTLATAGGSQNVTPTQWFNAGPAPIANGQTLAPGGTVNGVSGRVTSVATDPSDANIIYIGTSGGGSWKTINGGASWTPLFDGISAVETVQVQGTSGTFTLSYGANTTLTLSADATADQVQAALNALPSVSGAGGAVSVTAATTPGVSEVQQLNLTKLTPSQPGQSGDSFTLAFNGATSAPIPYTRTAADLTAITNALDGLASVGGLTPSPGFVLVTANSTFTVFTITFGGSLGQQPLASLPTPELVVATAAPGGPNAGTILTATPLTTGVFPLHTYTIVFGGGTFASQIMPTEQQLDLTGATPGATFPAGSEFTLTFTNVLTGVSATSAPITYHGDPASPGVDTGAIAAAFNTPGTGLLAMTGVVGGSVTVTADPTDTLFTIFFGGTLAGLHQDLIVATAVPVPSLLPQLGNYPSPFLNFFLVSDLPTSLTPVTVVSTGTLTTTATFNNNGSGTQAALYVGAIAIAPSEHNTIYLGTGDGNNSADSFAGTGVYKSTDAGQSWSLLTNTNQNPAGPAEFDPNPIAGLAITAIVVDPGFAGFPTSPIGAAVPAIAADPNLIYVATSNVNIQNAVARSVPAIPGVYRFNPSLPAGNDMWFNLTSTVSPARGGGSLGLGAAGVPANPGPDDDFRMSWWTNYAADIAAGKVNNQSWTDLKIVYADPTRIADPQVVPAFPNPIPILYAALGNSTGNDSDADALGGGAPPVPPTSPYQTADAADAIFRTEDAALSSDTNVSWWVGDHGPFIDQQDQIVITAQDPLSAHAQFTLSIYGKNTPNFSINPADVAASGGTLGFPSGGLLTLATPANIQAALSKLIPAGGTLTLIPPFGTVAGVTTVTLVFGGLLSTSPQPQIQIVSKSGFQAPSVLYPNEGIVSTIFVPGGGIDTRSVAEFPALADGSPGGYSLSPVTYPDPNFQNGNIKFAAIEQAGAIPFFGATFDGYLDNVTIYATITHGDPVFPIPTFPAPQRHEFLQIEVSSSGGKAWSKLTPPELTDYMGLSPNDVGDYASTIVVDPTDKLHVLVASVGDNSTKGLSGSGPWETTDGGATWADVGTDGSLNGPSIDYHASAFDAAGNVIFGNDGGVFRLEDATSKLWQDLNTNLSTTQFNGIDVSPNDINQAVGAAINNGTESFSGLQSWQETNTGSGDQIFYDPKNPLIVFATQRGLNSPTTSGVINVLQNTEGNFHNQNILSPNAFIGNPPFNSPAYHNFPADFNNLLESVDGGQTWNPAPLLGAVVSFAVDTVNDQRLVAAAGGALKESNNQGVSFVNINNSTLAPHNPLFNPSVIALATFQGVFQADARFPNVLDQGPDTYVPDTIYAADEVANKVANAFGVVDVTTQLWVTKDHGVNWVNVLLSPTSGFPKGVTITDLEVDPRNRDTVYAVLGGFLGSANHVFVSTNAGQTWSPVGAGLPDVPAWKLVIDPRSNNLYLGSDRGVYVLTGGTGIWTPFGIGLPQVQVRDLVLNQGLETLTAGTYGRGMYQFFLSAPQPFTGAERAVAGSDVWAGPVTLLGPTTISADGVQGLQNGVSNATLTFTNTISDFTTGANYPLTKIGQGDVALTAANTYGGTTEVKQGILIVGNAEALGTFTSAVQTVTVSQPAGPFTLSFGSATANLTVGESAVLVQAALNALPTIGGIGSSVAVGLAGDVYTITFGGTLAGIAVPNLVASTPAMNVVATTVKGVGGTVVDNGSVLQLESDVQGEPLEIFGNGLTFNGHSTGALRNISHDNTYTGPLTLMTNATIGVDSGFTLTIGTKAGLSGAGTVTDNGNNFNLTKELTGTLVLADADTYGGNTFVNQGALQIENSTALGAAGTTTQVTDGAQLQVQTPTTGPTANTPVQVVGELLNLSGTGLVGTGALRNLGGANAWGGTITLADLPGFAPTTAPAGAVAIGVDAGSLALGGAMGETIPTGLSKVGAGTLILYGAGTYTGSNFINAGIVSVESSGALGANLGREIQRITTYDPSGVDTFQLSFNGQATPAPGAVGALPFGSSALAVQTALNGLGTIGANGVTVAATTLFSGVSEVQTLTLTNPGTAGAAQTNFTLKFNGSTTGPIAYTGTAATDAAAIAAALNGLPTIATPALPGASAGMVSVTADATDTIFTITFINGLQQSHQAQIIPVVTAGNGSAKVTETIAGQGTPAVVYTVTFVSPSLAGNQPQIGVTPAPAMAAVSSIVADGGIGTLVNANTALQLDGDPLHTGASLALPATETIALNGTGVNGAGAFHNVSGNNTWAGAVNLQSDASISANPTTTLTITGVVQDPLAAPNLPLPVPASHAALVKSGLGTVVFAPNQSTPMEQDLAVAGTTGTFTLGFAGSPMTVTTGAITTSNLTAPMLQTAINSMLGNPASPGGGMGNATVTAVSGGFVVTFGGSLIGTSAPLLTVQAQTGTTVATVRPGDNTYTGNTFVDSGILNIQTPNGLGFNTSEQQQVAVSGTSGSFILGFTGFAFPGPVNTAPIQTSTLTAATLEAALNKLLQVATSPGLGSGTATVVATGSGTNFTVTFGGSLQGLAVPLLVVENTVPNTSVAITRTLPGGQSSTTVDRNATNQATLQLQSAAGFTEASLKPLTLNGTGFNNGALENVAGNNTWGSQPITLASTSDIGADGSTILLVDQPIGQGGAASGLTKVGTGVVQVTGAASNTYTGLTTVVDGTLLLDKTGGAIAVAGNLTVGNNTAVAQVQTLTLAGFAAGDQFTLSYAGATSAPIAYAANPTFEAAAIQAALNAILAAGATATVTPTATAGVYSIALGGTLAATNPAALITGAAVAPSTGTATAAITTPGGPPVANAALAQLLVDQQIANTAAVIVNSDGKLDLNNHAQAVTSVAINSGTITTGTGAGGGTLTVANTLAITDGTLLTPGTSSLVTVNGLFSMQGGLVNLSGAKSQLTIAANGSAVSDATGSANITGQGTVALTGTTPTLTVNAGPQRVDLDISAPITSTGGLLKAGAGRLELNINAADPYGLTTIAQGDVEVEAGTIIGDVALNAGSSGSLSGTGTVGNIYGPGGAATTAIGTVNPGLNGGATPVFGILNSTGNAVWGPQTTFSVDLSNGESNAPPVAGKDYDQLSSTGNVSINNAILGGTSGLGTRIGDQFTIISTTGAVTGQFDQVVAGTLTAIPQGGPAFIGGVKYIVQYNPSSVVLTRTLDTATVAITSSDATTTSVYGQDVIFTATVTPEPGASLPAAGATITFTLDQGTPNQHTFAPLTLNSLNQATVDPQSLPAGLWTVGSAHTIDAVFNDSTNTFLTPVSAPRFTDTVVPNNVSITLTPQPAAPVYGQQVTVTATVVPTVAPTVAGTVNPTGDMVFTLDPGTPTQQVIRIPLNMPPLPASENAVATFSIAPNLLAPGAHTITVSYVGTPPGTSGDGNYNASATPISLPLTVAPDGTSPQITSSTGFISTLGTNAQLSVTVMPNATGTQGVPIGTVNLYDGALTNPVLATTNYTGSTVNFSIPNLSQGAHTIFAQFTPSDSNYTGSSSKATYKITQATTATTFISPPANTTYGQSVVFTVSVVPSPSIGAQYGTPSGSVTFFADSMTTGANLGTAAINGGTQQASITTPPLALTPGQHSIIAVYTGDTKFSASQATFTPFFVVAPSTTALTSSASTTVFGQPVTFTATVAPNAPTSIVPSGTVVFDVNGVAASGPIALNGSGVATFTTSTLSVGMPVVTAIYSGDHNFAASTSNAVTQTITASGSATTLSTSAATVVYSQSVTITATVAAVAPGAGTPTGTVVFQINNGTTTNNVTEPLMSGVATLGTTLAVGTYTITTSYAGDGNFTPSTGGPLSQTVTQGSSTTSLAALPSPAVFGQSVTFTATVAAVAPSVGTPTSTVTFTIDGTAQAPVALNASGQAILTTAALAVGSHSVSAVYNGDGNFTGSSAAPIAEVINQAGSTTTLATTQANAPYGQATITATVAAVAPGAGTPTGTVTFLVNNGTATTNETANLVNGVATLSPPLGPGSYSITASYGGDTNFTTSTASALTQTVTQGNSTTTLTSSEPTSTAGDSVTFTATVSAGTAGLGTPSGKVTFFIDGAAQAPITANSSGVATFTTNSLTPGTHAIGASYSGDANFTGSSAPTLAQIVKPNSTTTLATSASPTVSGQPVTFTATVASGSGGTPTGSITFTLDGTAGTPVALVGGKATLTITTFGAGTHTVVAAYSGDTTFAPSASGTLTQIVNKASVTTTLASSGSAVFGQPVTFTATINPAAPGAGAPSGTVVFTIDGTQEPVATVSGNTATFTTSALATGSHTVGAAYSGDANFTAGNSAPLTQVVKKASVTPVVTSSANPAVSGQPVALTVTIVPTAPGAGTPTGTVIFSVDGVSQPSMALSGGAATLTLSKLSSANHTITASYSGDGNFTSGTAAAFTQTVTPDSSTTTLASSGGSVFGQAVTLTATVAPVAPGGGIPTGAVTFLVDGTSAAVINLNASGQAIFAPTNLSATSHTITAVYSGDSNFAGSAGSLSQSVSPATPSLSIVSSATLVNAGQSVTFTAVVSGGSAPATPTGSVTFVVDGVTQVAVPLDSSGQAAFTTASLGAGNHSVTAVYSGDANYAPAASGTLSQTISTITAVISPSPAGAVAGKALKLTVQFLSSAGGVDRSINGRVTFSVRSGPGRLSGTVTVNAVNGVAVFTKLILKTTGVYTLRASGSGLPAATVAVSVSAGTLKVTGPSVGQVKSPFTLSVSATNSKGGVDSRFVGSVTASIFKGPRGARLSGKASVKMVKGHAVLKGLELNIAGVYYLRLVSGPVSQLFKITILGNGRRLIG